MACKNYLLLTLTTVNKSLFAIQISITFLVLCAVFYCLQICSYVGVIYHAKKLHISIFVIKLDLEDL